MYENFELLANAIILQAVRDYRHTYSPQVRAEIKRFFRSEWFRALTRVDGEMIIARLENERTENYEQSNRCIKSERRNGKNDYNGKFRNRTCKRG